MLQRVASVLSMVTNIYLMVAKESSIANPQKIGKINGKNQKNGTKIIWQHCFKRRIT